MTIEDNINNSSYLHLYEQIENLKLDLARTRENARKWHRKAQGIDKVMAENEWLKKTLRTIRDKHENIRRNHRSEFRSKWERLRSIERDLDQLIIDNLNNKLLGDVYLCIREITSTASGIKYIADREIVHPSDCTEEEQSEILFNSNMRASRGILIKRLIRERNIAIEKHQELMNAIHYANKNVSNNEAE